MRLDPIRHAYDQATGRWRGCDWPTRLGANKLNLAGLASADAIARAEMASPHELEDWQEAVRWLNEVERASDQAEMEAALALAAANAGDLHAALVHARRAAEREAATGRPHHDACWHCLEKAIEEAIKQNGTTTRPAPQAPAQFAIERDLARLQEEVRRLTARLERLEEAMTVAY